MENGAQGFSFPSRLTLLRRRMEELGLVSMVVAAPANRRYLSGFTGDDGFLFVDERRLILFTDFRFREQARLEAPAWELRIVERRLLPEFAAWLKEEGGERIGLEAEHWTLAAYETLTRNVPAGRLVPIRGVVEQLRAVKDEEELAFIAAAAAINDRVWTRFLPLLRPGVSERDLAVELEYLLRREGAEGMAFPSIVASGPRGALPHATPGEKRLAAGEMVVVDFGAVWRGYASDMTRTVALGRVGEEERTVYGLVLAAQERALEAIRAGAVARAVDAVARNHIKEGGYGEAFGHGLGHAVGLEVHEEPRLSPTSEGEIRSGMVFTVEPGVYLPGRFGVRIEDLVVVTEDGYRNLTKSPKELLVL
ncbi:MAG: aminopeptidase P family protein [Firmicutes bacterium]|nr:aminopeptidase P family protein [Bacillota bacterium]